MNVGMEKLKARLAKAEAARKKAIRQSQMLATQLSKQERRDDTRRKVIDGAHMQTEAVTNDYVAALLHKRRDENLIRDDDRALFGLPLLSDAEKNARGVAPARNRRASAAEAASGEAAALAEGFNGPADLARSVAEDRQSEPA